VPKDGSSANGSGGSKSLEGPRSEISANEEAKHDTEKCLEGVAAEQNKAQGEKIET
jgi:hypothetical protein